MKEMLTWADMLCTVAVICALCEIMIPQGNIARMFHFVLGMFLIVAILVPFSKMVKSGMDFKEDFSFAENQTSLSGMEDLSIAYGKRAVENIIAETLQENHLSYKKITVTMDSSQGNCIDMIEVTICTEITEKNRWKSYQQCIKEKTGITPFICAE